MLGNVSKALFGIGLMLFSLFSLCFGVETACMVDPKVGGSKYRQEVLTKFLGVPDMAIPLLFLAAFLGTGLVLLCDAIYGHRLTRKARRVYGIVLPAATALILVVSYLLTALYRR